MNAKIIIDVREKSEFEGGHVDGAINIPLAKLTSGSPELIDIDKKTEMIVYCLSGGRSNMAAGILKKMGFTNVVNGINAENVRKNC